MGDQEEFSQLPLIEQFQHKNWKARKGGYETAAKEFKTAQPTDAIVKDFTFDSGIWKGAVGDANAAAQQEALVAYNEFLNAAGADGARKTRNQTVAPAVEKGLTGRPAAKAAARKTAPVSATIIPHRRCTLSQHIFSSDPRHWWCKEAPSLPPRNRRSP